MASYSPNATTGPTAAQASPSAPATRAAPQQQGEAILPSTLATSFEAYRLSGAVRLAHLKWIAVRNTWPAESAAIKDATREYLVAKATLANYLDGLEQQVGRNSGSKKLKNLGEQSEEQERGSNNKKRKKDGEEEVEEEKENKVTWTAETEGHEDDGRRQASWELVRTEEDYRPGKYAVGEWLDTSGGTVSYEIFYGGGDGEHMPLTRDENSKGQEY